MNQTQRKIAPNLLDNKPALIVAHLTPLIVLSWPAPEWSLDSCKDNREHYSARIDTYVNIIQLGWKDNRQHTNQLPYKNMLEAPWVPPNCVTLRYRISWISRGRSLSSCSAIVHLHKCFFFLLVIPVMTSCQDCVGFYSTNWTSPYLFCFVATATVFYLKKSEGDNMEVIS